ncbi:ProQ/FinO family protein [Legionella fallonii]|uniref:ProQ/FinO domain-containing protein n=1 Tax=Legionella fallonii LLAP-10 TaxID=1212491 RepID=A0A098G110_9GAMM|nr:ProQ/FinO family protein [Legionella fallonii]CEG55669.1 conserved protein of unknown function [Legionella fallonii LLAP-10]
MRRQELHPRTAVINKKQKNKSKKARLDALSWLAVTFPNAFDNSVSISPLKKGIMADIMEYAEQAVQAGISKSKLREAVVLFTRRLDYLTCLKAREMRIDLQGNVVSEVTDEEAEHASVKIKRRVEKSVRNARKILSEKNSNPPTMSPQQGSGYSFKASNSQPVSAPDDFLPIYPPRSPQSAPAQPARSAAVVVKHKTTKQFDPDAIARLKEKLGLSRSLEEKKETAE